MTSDRTTATRWHLAQIKPNSHRIAVRNLARQGFDCFLPLCEETLRRGGRFAAALRPLFPGYVFVGSTAASADVGSVDGTLGVTRLVRFGDAPAAVPAALVDELRGRCDAAGRLMPPAGLRAGDVVTVTAGPFTDFAARIEAAAPDQRVWVLLDLMGRETRLALRADALRAS